MVITSQTAILLLLAALVGIFLGWIFTRSSANRTREEIESRSRSLEQSLSTRDRDLQDLRSQFGAQQAQVNSLSSSQLALQDKLNACAASLSSANGMVEQLTRQLNAVAAERDGLQALANKAAAEVTELRQALDIANRHAQDLAVKIETELGNRQRLEFDLRDLQLANDELKNTITSLENQAAVLEAQLADTRSYAENQVVALTEARSGTMAELSYSRRLEELLQIREASLADAQAQLASMRASLSMLTAAGAQVAVGYTKSQDMVNVLEDEVATAIEPEELEAARKQVADLSSQVESLNSAQADLEAALAEKNAALANLQSEQDALESVRTTIEAQLKARDSDLNELQARVAGLRAELESALPTPAPVEGAEVVEEVSDIDGLARDVSAIVAALAAQVDERNQIVAKTASLEDQLTALTADKGGLEAKLQEQNAAQLDLQAQLEALRATKTDLEAQLQASDAELDQVLDQVDAVRDELKAALPNLVVEVPATAADGTPLSPEAVRKAKLAALATAVAATTQSLQQKQQVVMDTSSQASSLQEQLDVLRFDEVALEVGIKQRDADLAKAQQALEELQAGKAELEATLQQKDAVLAEIQQQQQQLQARMAELETGMQQKDAALLAVQGGLQKTRDTLMQAQEELQQLQTGKADLEAQLQAKTAELDALTTSLEGTKADLQAQVEDLKAVKIELEANMQAREAELAEAKVKLAEAERVFATAPNLADMVKALAVLPPPKKSASDAALRSGVWPSHQVQAQDLTLVKGVGPNYEQRLLDGGIGTYWELANLSDEDFLLILNLDDYQARGIDLDALRAAALEQAQLTNTVGLLWEKVPVDDFEPLPQLGRTYEKRLYDAGILTFDQMAAASVDQLAEICHAPEWRTPDYANWIAIAKGIVAERQATAAGGEPDPAS